MTLLIAPAVAAAALILFLFGRGEAHEWWEYLLAVVLGALSGYVCDLVVIGVYRAVDDGYGKPLLVLGVALVIAAIVHFAVRSDIRVPFGVAGAGLVIATIAALDTLVVRVNRSVKTATGLGLGAVVLIAVLIVGYMALNDD